MRNFKNIFVSTFAAFLFAAGFSVTANATDSDEVGEVITAAENGSTEATDRGGIEATDRGGFLSELINSMIGE